MKTHLPFDNLNLDRLFWAGSLKEPLTVAVAVVHLGVLRAGNEGFTIVITKIDAPGLAIRDTNFIAMNVFS